MVTRLVGALGLVLAGASGCGAGNEPPDPASLVGPASPATTTEPDAGIGVTAPAAACGDFCGDTFLHEIESPPNLYFLVDRSASMGDTVEGGSLSKYKMARKVLGELLEVIGHRVRYGAAIFPASPDACGPGQELLAPTLGGLPACDGTLDSVLTGLLTSFGFYVPDGATPTAAALAGVRSELEQLDGQTYLVLITDGAPNCDYAATCDAADCMLTGSTVGGEECGTDFNCCDADNTGPNGPTYCVDGDETAAEIQRLAGDGIPTYVVGMPGSEAYATVLEELAVAGGTARDGDVGYYAVTDEAELQAALYAIGTGVAIKCSIDLDAAPDDPNMVNVYFDGVLVPADPVDGWSWDGDTRIVVNGAACDQLKSGDVIDARAVFGCDTVVR
jgi:hypothetical protein